jgi:hypothetical protein
MNLEDLDISSGTSQENNLENDYSRIENQTSRLITQPARTLPEIEKNTTTHTIRIGFSVKVNTPSENLRMKKEQSPRGKKKPHSQVPLTAR